MNILIISPYLPHPRAAHGTAVFMHSLLRHISAVHHVTLVSFCDHEEAMFAEELRALPLTLHLVPRPKGHQPGLTGTMRLAALRASQFLRSVALWRPYYVEKYRHPDMTRLVHRLADENCFDILQCEFAYMGQYAEGVRATRKVLHEHDVSFRPAYRRFRQAPTGVRKAALFFEWCRWARYEPALAKRFDSIMTVTEQDRLLLGRLTGKDNIYHLPRGVEVPADPPPSTGRIPQTIAFVGTFSHQPNLDAMEWFLREIFPRVTLSFPQTSVTIVGTHAPASLEMLARQMPGVRMPGYVERVEEILDRSAVFVAPLRTGGGVKIKVLHAMARAIPVVTTKVGIEGIGSPEARIALVGRTAEELAGHILALFSDPDLAARIGGDGHAYVQEHYSWQSVIARLGAIYNETLVLPTHSNRKDDYV